MLQIVFTRTRKKLADADIYDITPVAALHKLLNPEKSLCLVHRPRWNGEYGVEMQKCKGKDRNGNEDCVYLETCSLDNQCYIKNRLDRKLDTAYLFCSWKKAGFHTFRLVQHGKAIAAFTTFEQALNAYLPEDFQPIALYRRKHNIFSLMGLATKRRCLLKRLLSVISEYSQAKS